MSTRTQNKMLPTLDAYLAMSQHQQLKVCKQLLELSKKAFELISIGTSKDLLPTFLHKKSGFKLKYIPSGRFSMGLSEKEERAAKRIHDPLPVNFERMQPVTLIRLDGFLMSTTPILTREYITVVPIKDYKYPDYPAHVTYEEASTFATQLGCRLPREAEWEYACRGTTDTLFVWGDALLPDKELEKWINSEYCDKWEDTLRCNKFGLYGLFDGEWCMDEYRSNYNPETPVQTGEHVVRGGGSLFWPWQNEEWVWCMSSMRMSSSGLFDDRAAAFRLVYEFDTSSSAKRKRG